MMPPAELPRICRVGQPIEPFGVQSMTRLTRDDVITALGQVDDIVVAEILGTGATAEELAEAQAWLSNNEALMNSGRPLATGRVSLLIEILEDIEKEASSREPAA
jgi:hypothetical protein